MTRTCLDCPAEISRYSTGRCRSCASRSPEKRAASRACLTRRRMDADFAAKMIAASTESRMSWCPPEYRELNRELVGRKVRLADRQRMIADQAASDRRRAFGTGSNKCLVKVDDFARAEA